MLAAEPWSRVMSTLHGSIVPSTMLAVVLSNDMCRQNLPSGIVTTTSPEPRASSASPERCRNGSTAAWPPNSKAAAKRTINTEEVMTARLEEVARDSPSRLGALCFTGAGEGAGALAASASNVVACMAAGFPRRIAQINNRIIESAEKKCF